MAKVLISYYNLQFIQYCNIPHSGVRIHTKTD